MGAAQSDLGEFEDPGPPVTKGRILKAVKWAKLPQPLTLNLCTFNFQVMGGNRGCGGGRDCGEGGECKGGGLHVQPGFHHCQGQGEGWGQDLRVGGQIYSQRGQQVFSCQFQFISTFSHPTRANLSENMASDEREVGFYSTLMPMLKKVEFTLC